jgi:hypothetical protein
LGPQPGGVTDGVTEKFPRAGHKADGQGARAQDEEKGAEEASSPFVRCVREKAHDAQENDKTKRQSTAPLAEGLQVIRLHLDLERTRGEDQVYKRESLVIRKNDSARTGILIPAED